MRTRSWTQNRLTVIGPEMDAFAFIKKAQGPMHQTKASRWEQQLAIDMTPRMEALSFHQIVPIPEAHLDAHAIQLAPVEERLWGVRYGGIDSLFYGTKSRENKIWGRWDFETYDQPPIRFLANASMEWETLSFFLSWNTEHIVRGRSLVFRYQDLSFEEVCRLSTDNDEDPENWSLRLKLWAQELFDTHDSWVEELTAAI